MNSTIKERVRFVEKEGLFNCLAEESIYRRHYCAAEAYWWSTMRHPSDGMRNRLNKLIKQRRGQNLPKCPICGYRKNRVQPSYRSTFRV